MSARLTGAALMALGAVIAVLPAFAWYSAGPAGRPVRASGFAAAGELWLLPPLGAAAVLGGAALAATGPASRRRVARWAGPLAAVAGAIALGLALRAGLDPHVELRVALPGGVERVPAAVRLEPAAVVAPLAAGLAVAIGAVTGWIGARR
jgi:hypothetical protein